MAISVFDLFTIGIGPSSSHSVGPMRAAHRFVRELADQGLLARCHAIETRLYGSLALTGKGHGTDRAILLGLEGETPETVDPDTIHQRVEQIRSQGALQLTNGPQIDFKDDLHLLFLRKESLPIHPNGICMIALDDSQQSLLRRVYYSIGGGFVVDEEGKSIDQVKPTSAELPYPFHTGDDLLRLAAESQLSISEMVLQNEMCFRSREEIFDRLLCIWKAMQDCVAAGCRCKGTLPGGLKVQRRAAALHEKLLAKQSSGDQDPLAALDWVDVFALAVSEENAAGGRIVTAPTKGAAGIIPAVMHYFHRFCEGANDEAMMRFLLTAGAIAMLYKENASLSGAEVGCQGEVGVACSMAAGALTEVLGGDVLQVEQAAEIGMEHHLGLTCDPVGGLVQVPCIERNAVASVSAIHASRLALSGDGQHRVSLDKVIATMRQTGADMLNKYKETSRGGLAVNVVEC